MAKINRFIVQYAELLKDVKIDFDGKKPPKYLIKRFVNVIKETVNDPRYENMCTYPIETVLVTAFIGVLCNASNWAEIHDVADDNKKWLSKFVPIPNNRVPIDDTYRRVFSLIDSNELTQATKKYLISIFRKIKGIMEKYIKDNNISNTELIDEKGFTLINIDGKVARGTGRYYDESLDKKKINNLETLNVYNASDGVSLFSIPIDNKENEIPVAQNVISKLNLKNTIITMDALHAQHKTFDIITKRHGDFVIGLKQNQKEAYTEVNSYITDKVLENCKKNNNHYKIINDNKGNKEYYLIKFSNVPLLEGTTQDGIKKWIGCRSIVVYRHINPKTGELIDQYFITSLTDLDTIVEAIVYRWDVENLLHRYLDVSFDEDLNKTMNPNAFNNFSIINKLCLTLLKLCKPLLGNRSMIRMRKSFSRKPVSYLFSVLAILDIDTIEQAFNKN